MVVAVLAAALLVEACSLGNPAQDASGEEIYVQLCSRCHGTDLSGGIGPSLGAGSHLVTEDDEYLVFTVLNGRGRMPSFPKLDDEQIQRLVDYIREAQGS